MAYGSASPTLVALVLYRQDGKRRAFLQQELERTRGRVTLNFFNELLIRLNETRFDLTSQAVLRI